jgi:cell division protein FtsZ
VVIGTILDPDLGDEIRVTVVATGLSKTAPRAAAGMQAAAGASRPRPVMGTAAPSVPQQPSARPAYDDYEEPAINRRAPAPAPAPAKPAPKSDLLNVPAFLRRQQNSDQ